MRRDELKTLVVHLRLHFQLLLAPVFLWGWLIAGGGFSLALAIGFVALHVFLYSGATAFNSYYDRDVGPIAGIERPVALPSWSLAFSLAWQVAGAVLALLIGPALAALYAVYATVGMLYSHPRCSGWPAAPSSGCRARTRTRVYD